MKNNTKRLLRNKNNETGNVSKQCADSRASGEGGTAGQLDVEQALLEGKQNPFGDYSSQSGEIVGMLKAMKDEMDKDLKGIEGCSFRFKN